MAEHVNTIFFEINTRKLEIDRITQRFDTSFDPIKTNSHFILEKEREYLKSSPWKSDTFRSSSHGLFQEERKRESPVRKIEFQFG